MFKKPETEVLLRQISDQLTGLKLRLDDIESRTKRVETRLYRLAQALGHEDAMHHGDT